jgi:hypothetical protein
MFPAVPPPAEYGAPARAAVVIRAVQAEIAVHADKGRDLDKQELRSLAASLAAQPGLWERQVAFSDERRHFVSLYRDAHVDVWVLCWTPQNDTGWHDHDLSSGALAVARGALIEHTLAVGRPSIQTAIEAGNVVCFGQEHIHRLTGREQGSVSVHAYSPPLCRMGQYTVTSSGLLKRLSVSYADELRPIDAGAETAATA